MPARGVGLVLFIVSALASGCGAAETPRAAPPDRCAATMTSLRALEPACFPPPRDGGVDAER